MAIKRDNDPSHAALQLMLTETASSRLLPPLTQTFCEAATEDTYQMTCSHSRACGLTMLGISALGVASVRAVYHMMGYLTDENAPLRNSPAIVGSYVLMSVASVFLFSFGLYSSRTHKRAMEMSKALHTCTRAAVIAILLPCSVIIWVTFSLPNVDEWKWFLLGALMFTVPYLTSAMRLSVLEIVFPTSLLLASLLTSRGMWHLSPWPLALSNVIVMMGILIWYLCWLEQNHRSAFLAKLSVLRLQSELQASETSRLEEKTQSLLSCAKLKLQEADLARVKIQLMTMTCAPSDEFPTESSPLDLSSIAKVGRDPLLQNAWGETKRRAPSNPKFPCIAVTSTDDAHYAGRALSTKGVLGQDRVIKQGSHSFVKIPEEPHLRVSTMAMAFGSCPGHPMLASESTVQYAGEIEFDENQCITRWSNMSGTYQCPDNTAFQAGLPLDKFYAVRSEPGLSLDANIAQRVELERLKALFNEGSGEFENDPRLFRAESGAVLEKILGFTENAFMEVQASWNQHQSTWLANEHDARECHERIVHMTRELQAAISKYGYLSETTDVWSSSILEE